MKMIEFLLLMLAVVVFSLIGGFLLMKVMMMTNEKIVFYVSLVGFSGLLVLQAVLRAILESVAPAGLIVIGLAMGFCAVGAATAYRLISRL